jgi:hypothetical protein
MWRYWYQALCDLGVGEGEGHHVKNMEILGNAGVGDW